jgi:hypothetical protein
MKSTKFRMELRGGHRFGQIHNKWCRYDRAMQGPSAGGPRQMVRQWSDVDSVNRLALDLSDHERKLVLRKNALRLFGLNRRLNDSLGNPVIVN